MRKINKKYYYTIGSRTFGSHKRMIEFVLR